MSTRTKTDSGRDVVVVNLGKKTDKKVRKLKRGKGPLPAKVDQAVERAIAQQGGNLEGKVAVPVVVVVEKKSKKIRWHF